MSKTAKIILTVVLSVVFLLIFYAMGNSGAEVGSPMAYLSILLIAGFVAALIAIWKKKKNPDLWQEFLTLYRRHRVTFHWIKGHAGHPENERCDRLAVEAYSDPAQLPEDAGFVEDNDNNLFQI